MDTALCKSGRGRAQGIVSQARFLQALPHTCAPVIRRNSFLLKKYIKIVSNTRPPGVGHARFQCRAVNQKARPPWAPPPPLHRGGLPGCGLPLPGTTKAPAVLVVLRACPADFGTVWWGLRCTDSGLACSSDAGTVWGHTSCCICRPDLSHGLQGRLPAALAATCRHASGLLVDMPDSPARLTTGQPASPGRALDAGKHCAYTSAGAPVRCCPADAGVWLRMARHQRAEGRVQRQPQPAAQAAPRVGDAFNNDPTELPFRRLRGNSCATLFSISSA